MKVVGAPTEGVFRVGRGDRQVFAPPDWQRAGRNRFDDPARNGSFDPSENFQVVYCATSLVGSFVETLQEIRPLLTSIAELETDKPVLDRGDRTSWHGSPGVVPPMWRHHRHWGRSRIATSGQFVDVGAAETISDIRSVSHIARVALKLGLHDIDVSAMTGPCRELTQAIARHVYTSVPDSVGIRYVSRFGTEIDYECWAAFDDRVQFEVERDDEPLLLTTPGFMEAVDVLHLVAEPD